MPEVSALRGLELESAIEAIAGAFDQFLHGDCVALALALRAELGGALVGVMDEDVERGRACLAHAVLEDADGRYLDVRGRRSPEAVLQDFDTWSPWTERATPARLRRLNYRGGRIPRSVAAEATMVAARLAPLIRAQRFEAELEASVAV